VLRLSNKQVRVVIAPKRITTAYWRGWPTPALVNETVTVPDPNKPPLSPLGDAIAELAAREIIDGAHLAVDVADSLVQFDIAVGDFAGHGARQLQAFAEASIAELLGDRAVERTVRWFLQRDEHHLLICAMPGSLLAEINESVQYHSLRLASVQPAFIRQWNRHAVGASGGNRVFVVADGAVAMIACVRDGVVRAVSSGAWYVADDHGACLLDDQVDRLLAGLGVETWHDDTFQLIGRSLPQAALSARWTVLPPSEMSA
jgi:hypothetical protein